MRSAPQCQPRTDTGTSIGRRAPVYSGRVACDRREGVRLDSNNDPHVADGGWDQDASSAGREGEASTYQLMLLGFQVLDPATCKH